MCRMCNLRPNLRLLVGSPAIAKVPFSFLATQRVYGTGMIETLLRNAGKDHVVGFAANHVFLPRASSSLAAMPPPRLRRAFPTDW